MWKRGEIAPEEQFLLLSTIFCYLMSDFYVETRIRFSLRDKQLFEITEVKITRVDCTAFLETVVIKLTFLHNHYYLIVKFCTMHFVQTGFRKCLRLVVII